MNKLFKILTGNIHFNATKLDNENFNQNWEVPEALISVIGLKNGKKPVFYYGIKMNCEEKYELIKGTSDNGNKFINARLSFKFDKQKIIENDKYIVANGFDGLLLTINVDKNKFISTFEEIIMEGYNSGDGHIIDVLDRMKERNDLDTVEESAKYIANRDYNWLLGRLKYTAGLFNYSGCGYWLMPLKTKMELTRGLLIKGNEIIINLENTELFKSYILYVDAKINLVRYNVFRLCKKEYSLMDEVKKQMKDDICPWCGEKLRTIKTRKGEFLGCTGYPTCLYRRFSKK